MKNISPFSRFVLVGLVNTAVSLTLMYFLFFSGLSYWISTFIGNLVGACVSYLLNKTFTFRSEKSVLQTIFRFFLVVILCYLFAYYIGKQSSIWLLQNLLLLPSFYSGYLAIFFGTTIYTILNYFGQKNFVFNK
ncbi:GtrA family protein [Aquibacillus halophilus]|uniref:GtrA family protein n=1 Tax=Aquibacillus halophilus TaxID=930132 RepID=A0A6A8D963_9BACI|nr:GtrA family protein [Aquibacillus halophilus]MRH42128.1 GtrA family protein [Aquibacillus halophilus]